MAESTDAQQSLQRTSLLHDFSAAAFWAGITAFVWYAFGAVPLQIAVSEKLGLSADQSSSWIFIVWFSGALSSIALSLYYRQPIPITWSIPGLIYLGTLSGEFTYSEMVGANLLAGLLIVALGLLGIGGRIMVWLPLPIIMGMFAASILGYVTGAVAATVTDVIVAGSTVAGYLLGRLLANPKVPPVGLAVLSGFIVILLVGRFTPAPLAWALPSLVFPGISFSVPAFMAITLPMLVLAMGLGNVQGLGFLLAQGYSVPANPVTTVVGINSVVNAFFGGHPAIVARTGVAILASPEAGPAHSRYWANLVAAALTILIALAASPITSLLQVLPRSYIVALAGLAILSSLQDAFERAFGAKLRFGALVAFVVATTPFTVIAIPSDFWAIIAGLMASLIAERRDLLAHWRGEA